MNPELELLARLSDTDDAFLKAHTALTDAQGAVGRAEAAVTKATAARDAVKQEREAAKGVERDAHRRLEQYKVRLDRAVKALEMGVGDAAAAERQRVQCLEIIDGIETELLESMEAIEAIDERLAAAQSGVDAATAALGTAKAESADAIATAQAEHDRLLALRKPMHEELHPEIQRRYDALRRKKPPPVARIEKGACTKCRVTVPPQLLGDIRNNHMPACRGCGRWLVPGE